MESLVIMLENVPKARVTDLVGQGITRVPAQRKTKLQSDTCRRGNYFQVVKLQQKINIKTRKQ